MRQGIKTQLPAPFSLGNWDEEIGKKVGWEVGIMLGETGGDKRREWKPQNKTILLCGLRDLVSA